MTSRTQKRIAALMRLKFAMDHFLSAIQPQRQVEEATYRAPEPSQKAVAFSGR